MKNSEKNILVEELKKGYWIRKNDIRKRLLEFKNVDEKDYFYELVYCLLTPQTKAENSFKVVEAMKSSNYFIKPFSLKKLFHQKDGTYIRFHNQKEKYVIQARKNFDNILLEVGSVKKPFEKREWLVNNVLGFSYKESTHFLRNIGKNDDLAILDRHIIKNLYKYRAINSLPKTLSKKIYLSIEQKFQNFASDLKIDINEIDLLFWSMETGIILK